MLNSNLYSSETNLENMNDKDARTTPLNPTNKAVSFDIQQELNQLEEMIIDSPRIILSPWRLVDEDEILDQLDLVRLNLPKAFSQALDVLRQKEEILMDAEDYAQDIIETAQRRASEILDELGIIQQAQKEANQIRQQVQQECEQLQRSTLSEVEQMRRTAQQELEELRRLTLAECEDIQYGADEYADAVLNRIESQLSQMLTIIRNGRSQLKEDAPPLDRSATLDNSNLTNYQSLNYQQNEER
jgi:F0F1-type ATP synthase membrane subunit b/b'